MKRSFANLVQKKDTSDPASVFGNISVAAAAGEARVPSKSINFPVSDKLNHAMPTLEVTVISARNHPSPKMIGQIVVAAVVNKVKIPDGAGVTTTFNLPSGISVTYPLKKTSCTDPGYDKVSKPHALSDKIGLAPCSGVVTFTVKAKNNGPGGSDLKIEEHLLPGSALEVMRFTVESKAGMNGDFQVYCSADTVSPLTKAPFITCRPSSVVDSLFQSHASHRESVINGLRGTGDANHPVLKKWLLKDIEYLMPKLEELKTSLKNVKVGVNQPFEALAMSSEAEAEIDGAIKWMKSYLEKAENKKNKKNKTGDNDDGGDNDDNDDDDDDDSFWGCADIIDCVSTLDLSKLRNPVFLQSASSPWDKAGLGCAKSGVGPRAFDFTHSASMKEKHDFFCEALVSSDKHPQAGKSIGSLELNVVSTYLALKDPDTAEWVELVPKLSNNTAVCMGQLISSGKKAAAPALQVFDFDRMPLVVNEIVSSMPCAIFLSRLNVNNTKMSDTVIQPLLSGQWGSDFSVLDYVSGIRSAGVQVSAQFIDDQLCDDGEVTSMPAKKLFQYVELDSSGEAKQPARQRFELTGFNCLNSFDETKFKKFKTLSNLPNGADAIEYYAIYEGSSVDVIEDEELNKDAKAGSVHIMKKINEDKAFATEKMCVFSIACVGNQGVVEEQQQQQPAKKKAKTDGPGNASDSE